MTTMQDLADQIARTHDLYPDGALALVRLYAHQIEDLDHRVIDEDDIDPDDADTVLGAAGAGILNDAPTSRLDDLADLAGQITDQQQDLDDLTNQRNLLIANLLANGTPVPSLVQATGLVRQRIYQIRDTVRRHDQDPELSA
jgi:hypothetical protein